MANLVSLLRTLLSLLTVSLLFYPSTGMYVACFISTVVVIAMDALDGYLARKLNESSKMGAVIDILGDRIVEQVYWVAFVALGWMPLWVALTVIVRGIVVDGVRSIALEQGFTAFGGSSMQQASWAKFIVASNFSRTTYAVCKAVAFALLVLGHTPTLDAHWQGIILAIGTASAYIAILFCVARGIPVLIEGRRFF
jgi:CDP-diacylglycerol---glycerol-3-phosphate 3-phosphatidyltransferase